MFINVHKTWSVKIFNFEVTPGVMAVQTNIIKSGIFFICLSQKKVNLSHMSSQFVDYMSTLLSISVI